MVGEQCSRWRVRSDELTAGSLGRLLADSPRVLNRKKDRGFVLCFVRQGAQGDIVVEDVDPPAERSADEVSFPLLNLDVPERDRRGPGHAGPTGPAVERDEQAELRPGEE